MLDSIAAKDRVRGVVYAVMEQQKLSPPSGDCDDLFAAGLNSMAMVRLMLAIEVEFGVTIPSSDLVPDNFRSIRSVEALVDRLTSQVT
jgi:acyl carrier protein